MITLATELKQPLLSFARTRYVAALKLENWFDDWNELPLSFEYVNVPVPPDPFTVITPLLSLLQGKISCDDVVITTWVGWLMVTVLAVLKHKLASLTFI